MSAARPVPTGQVLVGDAATRLRQLPPASVDMVLTSPPYYRLRRYDGDTQLGMEVHVDQWVDELGIVARGLQRVLKPTGTLWLNLGDSYATHPGQGAPRKSLLLGPERVASQLVANGWSLRNKVVWQKANPMPTSVRDRLACTWEYLYVFACQPAYYFDLDALRIPHRTAPTGPRRAQAPVHRDESWRGPNANGTSGLDGLRRQGIVGHAKGKNPGDVWRLASSSYRGPHHATFPIELARRAVLAGCPPGGVVLDPFMGAGTTALAAEQLGRQWVGIELNPDYVNLTTTRLQQARASPASESRAAWTVPVPR